MANLPANAMPLNDEEKIVETLKTTTGYFTNGDGTLEGVNTHTSSLSLSNRKYYVNVSQAHPSSASSATQFSLTYGHAEGSGSEAMGDTGNANGLRSETEAIYKQFANLLMEPTEASGGFKISQVGTSGQLATGKRDDDIYVLIGKRDRFKDRINKKSWTMTLSGSDSGGDGKLLTLTDDSFTVSAKSTPAGDRYNIVSGTLGTAAVTAAVRTYGWFYPDMGMMVFSAAEMSGSDYGISGVTNTVNCTGSFSKLKTNSAYKNTLGFAPNLHNQGYANNHIKFVNCFAQVNGTNFRLRSEEDQTQINYFCRVKPKETNFSNNPTFVSGSGNKIVNVDMHGNPQTFISGIGLYNGVGQLVAVARLSSPLKKNFSSEATIKVKLTY